MTKNNKKALVVFSGGQDSTTCLFWALANYAEVIAITFNYGQKNKYEIECATQIAKELNLEHHILDMSLLNQLAPSSLTRDEIAVDTEPSDGKTPPNSVVDGRNHLFLSFAAVLAKQKGITDIITGVGQTDYSCYPDCRDVFIKSLNVSLNLAMDYNFVILTPLMWLDKSQIWQLADSLGKLDYVRNNTLTCYNNIKGDGCGNCPSCKLRKRGLDNYLASKK